MLLILSGCDLGGCCGGGGGSGGGGGWLLCLPAEILWIEDLGLIVIFFETIFKLLKFCFIP